MAGTHSGVGKTTVTLGLMAALVRRGLAVAPFKVGPDFIDPGHHARITGRPGRTLDGWMLSRSYNAACFDRHSRDANVAFSSAGHCLIELRTTCRFTEMRFLALSCLSLDATRISKHSR